jgi:carboxypeptidase Taq
MLYFKNSTILKILDYYKDLWSLSYLSGLASWDLETYMPKMAANFRGEALARVSTIRQKKFLDKEFVSLINKADKEKDLNDYEKGVVRIMLQSLKLYQKVPSKFLEEFEILTNKATVVWADAKLKNDFNSFKPYLEKIFQKNKELADLLGYEESPYDALLDLYEEELTSKDVTKFFDVALPPLKTLLNKIVTSPNYKPTHFLESKKYDKNKMIALNEKVLKDLWSGYGREGNFRLDVSSHPFTISFNSQDTRITTWYNETDFARSLMATVHEFGHGLYDMQYDDKLNMTPIAGGSGLVIHESQSRFWENHIGRSKEFIKKYIKDIRSLVNKNDLSVDDVYSYLNLVKPSLLRIEADEVTYHMHIALRFEIEKGLIEGKLKVNDIQEIWNTKMKDYLGITPKTDKEGVLQDIHWAHGSVGYFPTYSMGTFLGSQWEEKISSEGIGNNRYQEVEKWLKNKIHRYGSTYTLKDLLRKNKMKFDPSVNIKYLENKYTY